MFEGTAGSQSPRIIIVGEAWGAEEARLRTPFIGQSGRELMRLLAEAGLVDRAQMLSALAARDMESWRRQRDACLVRAQILLCNVISEHPPGNDFTHFLYPTVEAKAEKRKDLYGVYPRPNLAAACSNLHHLINLLRPDLIIACGNWPLHILSPHRNAKTTKGYKLPTGIAAWRGSQTLTSPGVSGEPTPLLPLIHPAYLLRDWSLRHVTLHDLRARAFRYLHGQCAWSDPPYHFLPSPTFSQCTSQLRAWLDHLNGGTPLWLSVDIETYQRKHISCIGLADGEVALCIPFFLFDDKRQYRSYWSIAEETEIILLLWQILEHPMIRIIGQNFIYDTQYIWRNWGIRAIVSGDTMVAHHLLFPGTDKDLAMLASLYCDHYCYWKDESQEWAASAIGAEQMWVYNCKDIRKTYEAWFTLCHAMEKMGRMEHYEERMEEWELAREMSIRGVRYNHALRSKMLEELVGQMRRVEEWLLSAVPPEWAHSSGGAPWFSSPQLTMRILYEIAGLRPILHKKTRQPTSDDAAINELLDRPDGRWLRPLLERLAAYRSAQVFKENFLEARLDPVFGRLCTQFNIAHPETFRWSSSKNGFEEGGNLQNLPKVED